MNSKIGLQHAATTAAGLTFCMVRLISAVRKLPLALRSLSRRAMASSPAASNSNAIMLSMRLVGMF